MSLARARDLVALEAAWMEHLESEQPDYDSLLRVARYLVGKGLGEQASLLLWALVESVAERAGARDAFAVAKRAVLIVPGDRNLREQAARLLRKAWPESGCLGALLEPDGVSPGDVPATLDRLERLLHFRPGAYVVHQRSRRVGRVKEFAEGMFSIEADGSTYRHDQAGVLEEWEVLPDEDFRALATFERERLQRMAAESPEEIVRLLLRTFGGAVEFKQFKSALVPAVIPADDWSRWWGTAREALRKSAWIDVSSGPQPRIALRDRPADFQSQIIERADAASSSADLVAVVLELLHESAVDAPAWRDTAAALAQRCLSAAGQRGGPERVLLLSALVLMHRQFPDTPDVAGELRDALADPACGGVAGVISALPTDEAARVVLDASREVAGEQWPEYYAQAFPAASLRLCDFIHRELVRAGAGPLFIMAAEQTVAAPEASAVALAWTWRHLLTSGEALRERLDPVSVTVVLLHLMHRIERMPRHAPERAVSRQILSRLRSVIGSSGAALLRRMIEQCDERDAQRLHEAITAGDGLPGEVRHDLLDVLREHHPGIFAEERPLWEDGYVYMTAEGLSRTQASLSKLVNEDMRKNAIAIGAAAAKGDLWENWEYKVALEERDRLLERAGRLREMLDRARVISYEAITGEHVTVGTRVRLRDPAGAERVVTFLGPPDADVERGIFSYLAPLSLRFMGKKAGERVSADLGGGETTWEIVAIERAL